MHNRDVIFILRRYPFNLAPQYTRENVFNLYLAVLSRIASLVCILRRNHLASRYNGDKCILAHFATQRTSVSKSKPGLHARTHARVRWRKRRHSRVSQCFNLSGSDFRLHKRPRASLRCSRGWLSSRLVHRGIFTLAPGTSRDDGDLLNERTEERRGRRKENVAEGVEELRSGHALFWRGREKSERKCVEKQWPSIRSLFVLMKTWPSRILTLIVQSSIFPG